MKFRDLSPEEANELVPYKPIVLGFRGSIAHNMYFGNTGTHGIDDKDIMGVYIGPKQFYMGFDKRDTVEKFVGQWDAVHYELRKYLRLLLKCNPNVLSLLWLEDRHYIQRTPLGDKLLKNRDLFVTKEAFHSFSGYAHSQLHKMTHNAHKGYMGQKRRVLVEKFGYDTKNAAHLVRLLRMGIEYLTDGELRVSRPDARELTRIKMGEWTLEQVQREAETLFALAKEAYVKSPLPPKPDVARAEALCVELIEEWLATDH